MNIITNINQSPPAADPNPPAPPSPPVAASPVAAISSPSVSSSSSSSPPASFPTSLEELLEKELTKYLKETEMASNQPNESLLAPVAVKAYQKTGPEEKDESAA
ncbi:hypothetical protein TWF506_009742 [Arthrobotrys conoides]|uniref:Uncharacterized protein n=1 Tax=Arthrobotrys conoides TaxID=74498 RepID=A0AAN8NC09_9PEZI